MGKRTRRKNAEPKKGLSTNKRFRKSSKEVTVVEQQAEATPTEFYNYAGVERLNATPSIRKTLRRDVIIDLMGKYGSHTHDQLQAELQNPELTILDRQVLSLMITGLDTSTQVGASTVRYIHDRIEGKVKDVIEHSGIDGKAIQMNHTQKTDEIDAYLDIMTDKELEAYEKMAQQKVIFNKVIQNRLKKVNESDTSK